MGKCTKNLPTRCWLTGLLVVLLIGPAAWAQSPAASQPAGALATKQQMILDRLARLEDRMFRLREKLAETEPENARKLADALRRAGEMDIKTRAKTLVDALSDSAMSSQATEQQQQLLEQYQALLDVLLDRNSDDARRKAELERLGKIKKDLDRLVQRQKDARQKVADRVRETRRSRKIGQAIERAQQLLRDQEELNRKTPDASANQKAQTQEELEQRARRLADDIRALKQRKTEDEISQQANNALKQAAAETQSAAQSMKQAAKETRDKPATKPDDAQKKAVDKLRRAIRKLEEAKNDLEKKVTPKSDAKTQRDLAEDAQKLSQKMHSAPEGDAPESKPKPAPIPAPAPGADNVERAEQHMQQAGDELDQDRPEQAAQKQDQALDELQRAQRELEDALRQKRTEDQEEKLRSLEARLKEMRAEQAQINEETVPLSELGAEHFARVETLKCAELADRQGKQADAGDICIRLLEEDGTTVVFPRVMRQLAGDLHGLSQRLEDGNVGPLTVSAQRDALATLDELLEALAKIRKNREEQKMAGGNSGGAGGGNDAPLVPTSAELKMLRNAQRRIIQQTQTAQVIRESGEESENALRDLLERTAARQAELAEMARDIQKRAEKEHGR